MAEEESKEVKKEIKKNLVEEAREQADRLEKGNAELKSLLEKQESLMASAKLAGKSYAGEETAKPETPREYKDRIMRGGK